MSIRFTNPPLISSEIQEVRQIIEKHLQVNNPEIQEALLTLQRSGGKMLRPLLLLYFAKMGTEFEQNKEKILKLAASIEVLHMATLIHDDIIDDSPLRRGTESLQHAFGKDIAVYAGDFLFTVYFELLAECHDLGEYFSVTAKAMKHILCGELGQMGNRFNQQMNMDTYLENIQGKTAELFSLACKLGTHFGGGNQHQVQVAENIGLSIGLAFQILDDILDYESNEKDLKKPVLEDLLDGIYTSPLLLTNFHENKEILTILEKKETVSLVERKQVKQLVIDNGGVEKSKQLAHEFTSTAIQELNTFPNSEVRNVIEKMLKKLLERTF